MCIRDRDGDNPNFDVVRALALESGLKVEIGGGIRSEETIKRYLDAGVWRVILGTIAVKDPDFTADMIRKYGGRVAVGVDIDLSLIHISCAEIREPFQSVSRKSWKSCWS